MLNQPKIALITGITGQDGAYLAELLLNKGYIIHGIKRRSSLFNTQRVDHLYKDPHESETNFYLHYGDMTDTTNIIRILQETQPDEIYNLSAQCTAPFFLLLFLMHLSGLSVFLGQTVLLL